MGGFGSGRRYQSGRNTTAGSWQLDIRWVQRTGALRPGRTYAFKLKSGNTTGPGIKLQVEDQFVVLVHRYCPRGDSEWQDIEQIIDLDYTACTYGGMRPWWLCPCCDRRVAILYEQGKLFACRYCCNLVYACQRENASDRAARRADSIRRRLGWKEGILNPKGWKPRGMHWRTYQRLSMKHDAFAMVTLGGIAKQFGMKNGG